jgi:molybdopterin synthase sulfur carrier subunit
VIRVILPPHLSILAGVGREVQLEVAGPVTQRSILDAVENAYPMLRGTIRDQVTHLRRPLLRFFVCEEDISHDSPDAPLPEEVTSGKEAFYIIGAIVGGK